LLEQLKCLVQYQILEDKKTKLVRSSEETPRRIAEIEKEFEDFESIYLGRKAEHEHAKNAHQSLEREISDIESKIKRSRVRMSEVKNNKEYQAILKEIEDQQKEIREKEDGALALMETIDQLSKELKTQGKEVEQRKRKMEEDKRELQREADQLKDRLDRLEGLQEKVRVKLEPDIWKRSELLLQKQAGIAVAPVDGGVCQVCHLNIPPQKFIELQRDESIMNCPHCHRFIYWPGHETYCVFEEDWEEL
jgi:predicted  nucleic acid-binding Zn-ribbon protein